MLTLIEVLRILLLLGAFAGFMVVLELYKRLEEIEKVEIHLDDENE